MVSDWQTIHEEVLNNIDRDMGIKYFRKSNVQGSFIIPTTDELNRINIDV